MPAKSGTAGLLLAVMIAAGVGCDPYSYYPSRTKPAAPAPTAGEAAPAPGTTPPPTPMPAPEPRPDLLQQVQALEARVQRLENQMAGLERPSSSVTVVKGPAPAPAAAPKVAPAPPPPAAAAPGGQDKAFQEGMRLYNAKKYGSARDKFSQYLKAQPQGGKATESRYYLADSFYHDKKYREASVEFNKLVHQHPKSMLAPPAMLRQALCYHQLKEKQNYQTTLKKLVQAYPQSAEAKEAQKWLKSEGR
jgi:tol-pal system protein YbgF